MERGSLMGKNAWHIRGVSDNEDFFFHETVLTISSVWRQHEAKAPCLEAPSLYFVEYQVYRFYWIYWFFATNGLLRRSEVGLT